MADDDLGRVLASGPLPMRGPRNLVPPRIILAVPGEPVVYETGVWEGRGEVTLTSRIFAAGIALSDPNGGYVPSRDDLARALYIVETAADRNGIPEQVVSDPAAVRFRAPSINSIEAVLTVQAGPIAPRVGNVTATLRVPSYFGPPVVSDLTVTLLVEAAA